MVIDNKTDQIFAAKIVNKQKLKHKKVDKNNNEYQFIEKEIETMKMLDHDNVLKLIEVIDDPETKKIYIILEYMPWGSLLSSLYFKKCKS